MLWCGEHNWLCFHTNVGKVQFWDDKIKDYRWFETGLPKGWPDLLIITDKGKTIYCETKIRPRKPTKDQLKVLRILKNRGCLAFVAYSLEEFIEGVKDEK